MKSCCVCFEQIGTNYITCLNYSCDFSICKDCFVRYIEFCIENDKFPKCPNAKCDQDYENSKYRRFLSADMYGELMKTYIEILIKKYLNYIDLTKNDNEFFNNVLKEKNDFIQNLPKAITFTINVALKEKKNQDVRRNRKMEMTRMKLMDKDSEKVFSKKKCCNLICDGYLRSAGGKYECNLCDTKFCLKCEKPIKGDGHQCSESDMETKKLVDSMAKCPNCRSPIEKNGGCNYMTCARCNTNFDMSTGKTSGNIGNDGKSVLFSDQKHEFNELVKDCMETYSDSADMTRLLGTINQMYFEKMKPINTEKNETRLINLLTELVKSEGPRSDGRHLSIMKAYDRFKKNSLYKSKFIKCGNLIEEQHNSRTLTPDILKKVIGML